MITEEINIIEDLQNKIDKIPQQIEWTKRKYKKWDKIIKSTQKFLT